MRIKSLELSGFKSFVDRTVINFEDGITGVVGPNGCGKSNIVDAIRWVMGEMSAKHLRGSAMEDVIFNGCDTRQAVGMAQVFLTFDNSDGRAPVEYAQYSEIQVGRRLYRSGESEYFINKTPCRLKDIVELFLGTGVGVKAYSIVEQGMVGNIVSSKPDDRRMLVEEAAGISKFKSRKEAALRKMESTRQNLSRLTDVLSELTRQMNSLHRQAKKAERFTRLNDELKERELQLSAHKFRGINAKLQELTSTHEALHEKEVSSSSELTQSEADIETLRLEMADAERHLDGVSQDLYRLQNEIKLNEAEINHKKQESKSLRDQNQRYGGEHAELSASIAELDDRISQTNTQLVKADLQLAGSSEMAETLEDSVITAKHNYEEMQTEFDELNHQLINDSREVANHTSALEQMQRRHIELSGRIAKNQTEIDGIDDRQKVIQEDLDNKTSHSDAMQANKLRLTDEYESSLTSLNESKQMQEDLQHCVHDLRHQLAQVKSRLDSISEIRKNLEGYRDGVRSVLSRTQHADNDLAGIMGTVGELFETDEQYEPALGAVLGEKLQYIVVKSHDDGASAIDYLQSVGSGRSSFIPMSVKTAENENASMDIAVQDGVIGDMQSLVRFSDDYKRVCQYLLKDVVLVSDLPKALDLWAGTHGSHTFVTTDGCVIDPSGVITGGAKDNVDAQLVAQKRKSRELEERLIQLNSQLAENETKYKECREKVVSLDVHVEQLKRDLHNEELKRLGDDRDISRLRDEVARYDGERDKLAIEISGLSEDLHDLEKDQDMRQTALQEYDTSHGEAQLSLADFRERLETANAAYRAKEKEFIEFNVEVSQAKERAARITDDIDRLMKDRIQARLGIEKRLTDMSQSNQRLVIIEREIESIRNDMTLAIQATSGLEDSKHKLQANYDMSNQSVRELELCIRDLRKTHDTALSQYHALDMDLMQEKNKCDHLCDAIRERYHLELADIEKEYVLDDCDVDAEEDSVKALKAKLEKIGSVNVDAIHEYKELNERHEFLSHQHQDLESSLENLTKAINKINRTSRLRFKRAFEAVNLQFQELFPRMFKGGKARLELTDEENVLESGVEIIAQPPGKKLQSISLLSGGEKALTAVALIFSIFLIKPSPFCLLDEVDAPLDDANVDRFNDLIRSMTGHSQFILITHNKRTMELSDLLYGVTMEESGVSKLVSVRLGQEKDPSDVQADVA